MIDTELKIDLATPLFKLTAGEFLELLEYANKPLVLPTTDPKEPYVYGLAGIAELFKCSKSTANRIKQSGKIDEAITQIGNLIITDAKKALQLAKQNKLKIS